MIATRRARQESERLAGRDENGVCPGARMLARAAPLVAALHAASSWGCVPLAAWAIPSADGVQQVSVREMLARTGSYSVVLLGESHESAEHHRWQLHTLAALHGQHPEIVLGFEMFPRRVQPVLDRWVAGELGEAEFLEAVHWSEVWGFDAAHYLPLFHFARMHRLPMLALNVERNLVRRIGREGPDAVPAAEREGVGRPAPATPAYLRELQAAYRQHGEDRSGDLDDPAFLRFVAGQLMWDRAMAEAIHEGLVRYPGRQMIAFMGRGHTGPGAVPHQLRALGVERSAVLLPWDRVPGCTPPAAGAAHAVFGVEPLPAPSAAWRPRLGIVLAPAEGTGVRVERVEAGSVAAAAGLRAGDQLVEIAGREVRRNADVLSAIRRQAPGTWLPLRVSRDGAEVELVAKFPAR